MKRLSLRSIVGFALLFSTLASIAAAQTGEYMTPTKQHEEMAHEVGVWDAEVTMWTAPDAEPMKSEAVETNKMLGKMWLLSAFDGEFGGQEFIGHMQFGYDPIKKKYVGTWIDTMSPFMSTMEGEYDADAHTLTMMGEGIDCRTGKEHKSKMVTRYEGEDAKVFEMYMPSEEGEGEWWKSMEAKYTRRK